MQQNNKERTSVILAALLHDIGKFVQRAQKNPKEQNHAYWGQNWIINNLAEKLNLVLGSDLTQKLITMVNCHHDGVDYISAADGYSAGEERIPIEDEEPQDDIIFSTCLKSIFTSIYGCQKNMYYKPNLLKDYSSIIPVGTSQCDNTDFQNLLDQFNDEMKDLRFDPQEECQIVVEKIFYLLMKYTWCLPSAVYRTEPDISLFEHLKTTAAIATCLYDLKDQNEKKFVLLAGDVSGIQDFIYSVTSEKALKGLRARSFYLQLLSETIVRRILDEFNLTICNLLFCGGGNFTILLPFLPNTEQRIEELKKEIDINLFRAHNGKLAINLAYVILTPKDFNVNTFSTKIEELFKELATQKRKKFSSIIDSTFLKPYPEKIDKELKACEICGKETEKEEICDLCKSFIDLSNQLVKAKIVTLQKVQVSMIEKEVSSWEEIFKSFGFSWEFFDDTKGLNHNAFNYLLNSTKDFIKNNCCGFRFEAIHVPQDETEILTLDKLADKSEGVKKWASLRMDVDNLGTIFSKGLDQKTISRYNMLSFMLSLFFSMGVKEIVENKYKNCCIVYSGGDDLFILGPWSELPSLAEDIRDSFVKYVCQHPKITLSGGIYIAPSKKFPVYQAAKEAGEAEEKAKKGSKNSITFLDKPVGWDKFNNVKTVCEQIVSILNGGVARSLLTILYAGYEDKKLFEERKILMVRIWRLFYAIKRFMQRYENFADKLEELRQKFITDFELIPELDLSVRWAELLTRKEGKNE